MISNKSAKYDVKSMTVVLVDDTQNFRKGTLSGLGVSKKPAQIFSPYGLCTNPPDDSMAISFNMAGYSSNVVAMVDDPKNRKKNLAKGEVAIVNYLTGAEIYCKTDGSIEISLTSGTKLIVSSSGIAITGNTSIEGDLNVSGKIDATGKITCDDLATSTISSLNLHVHNSGTLNIAGTPVTGTTGTSP